LATVATLIFVPAVFGLLHGRREQTQTAAEPADRHMTAGA
jgi:hypothetical protein